MCKAVERGLLLRIEEGLTYEFICLDEKAVFSGHRYITVMSDPIRKCVIDVVEHRTIEATTDLLDTLSDKQKNSIIGVAMDMWPAYKTSAKEVLPKAEIIHDKFHVIKKLNEAVDETRRQEKDPALKSMRYTLFLNKDKLNDNQNQKFQKIKELNLNTAKAWQMKETFKDLFYVAKFDDFYELFIQWLADVIDSGIKQMIKVANFIKKHIEGVLNLFKFKITNSAAEGLNAKIKEINIIGKGYKSIGSIRNAILFFNGKLNLFSHN